MSNSRVRKQIEIQEAKNKLLDAYKKKANFILDFQMCKAYFKDSAMSIMGVVENILKQKYNLPWQEKIIRKVVLNARGKSNAIISIPQFKYEKSSHDILKEFVEKNIGKMAVDWKINHTYPLIFNDLVRECS